MIDPAGIPLIHGDMGALTQHAAALSQVGTAFEDTGARVHGTWQGLAPFYVAPEAEQLLAATAPIPPITASIGEDLRGVGSALSGYAAEVTGIQTRLRALHGQALEFVAFAAANPDWLGNESDVDRHNQLLAAVSAAVADFQDAERRCANRILALYTERRHVVDNGDGVLEGDEHGFSAETLGALGEADALPWGRGERHDRGFLGDVGAFFVGGWNVVVGGAEGVAALTGLSRDGHSWETAGAAWSGLGMFALALTPVGIVNHYTDTFGIERGALVELVQAAGKELVAYDVWAEDPWRAAGQVTANVLMAVVGTKGAGAALRVTGTAAAASRIGLVANVGGGVLRVLEGVGRLPSVSDVAAGALARFPGLDIPPVALPPVIDLPPTHIDTPRMDPPPLPPAGSSIADALPPARPEGSPDAIVAPQDPPARPDGGAGALSASPEPPPVRPDSGVGTLNEPPPPRPDNGVGTRNAPPEPPALRPHSEIGTASAAADTPPVPAPAREPVPAGRAAAEPSLARPTGSEPGFGDGAGRFDSPPDGRAPDGPTASNDRPSGDGQGIDRAPDTGPDRTTTAGDAPDTAPRRDGTTDDPGGFGPGSDGSDSADSGADPDDNLSGGVDPDRTTEGTDGPARSDAPEHADERAAAAQHEHDLGFDPDVRRFRQAEAETGLRIEQERGVRLERAPADSGYDWVGSDGKTYDAVGNFDGRHFDRQWPNLQRQIVRHLGKADYVPVDVSRFDAAQVAQVREFIAQFGSRVFLVGG